MDSVFPFTGWAMPADWTNYRGTITTLYLEQNRPLKEVKRIMEEDYYFFATEKVYKTHLNKWGVQKNFRRRQVGELLAEKSRRATLGKSTRSFIHGRQVDEDRLNTYLKRIPPGRRKLIEAMASTSSRQGAHGGQFLVCWTPSPRPPQIRSIPPRLEAPDDLKAAEDSFHFIRVYIAGCNDSGLWETAGGQKITPMEIEDDWMQMLNGATILLEGGFTNHGFRLLSHWFGQYKELLRLGHPLLIIDTCWVVRYLVEHRKDLLGAFTDYVSEVSQTTLGSNHPLSSFFSIVKKAGLTEATPCLATFVQCYLKTAQIIDRFEAGSVMTIYSDKLTKAALCAAAGLI
ncbi:Clr5 domain-containing protein [Biscogniauxia marginata]|nr:Clr5 domain-containing protein [Biscogniauxia marginata]